MMLGIGSRRAILGGKTGCYRRFGVTMSLSVANQITFLKSGVITLGTRKRERRFFVNGATMTG